ncbi:TadE/TadG family type IV pilus assembly protein [Phenylobacterium montanum]|uniref:Pilus assembly protein n=1 Tax=Phenylobacterium montanum TaxID=2823693 RepID=A0A975IW28_9CAUL|nr:TadE/TadG family type IV pilus assembly protein [Caulobacter sp. S6]QUD89385.1 pilus assembly protein [Caulobacter sp. S6]
MMRQARRRGGKGFAADRSGATALEFAILSPALIMMIYGIFDMGLALYAGSAVRSAVQNASRTLITYPNTSAATIQASAQALLVDVPVNNLSVSITQQTISAAETVERVSWTYKYQLSIPLVPDQWLVFDSSLVVPLPPSN